MLRLAHIIVRIGHWECKPLDTELLHSLDCLLLAGIPGEQKSISKVLKCVFLEILAEFGECLDPRVAKRLQKLAGNGLYAYFSQVSSNL